MEDDRCFRAIVSGFGPFVRPLYEHIRDQVAVGYGGTQTAGTEVPGMMSVAPPPREAPAAT